MNEQDYIDEIERIRELQRRSDARWERLELTEQEEAIQRVRELHKPYWNEIVFCQTCDYPYPCKTIQALDGEQ